MQIIKHTRQQMIIHHKPALMWIFSAAFSLVGVLLLLTLLVKGLFNGLAFLLSLIFFGAGAGLLLFFSQELTITLDRQANLFSVERKTILKKQKLVRPFNRISGVLLIRPNDSEESADQVCVIMESGEKIFVSPPYWDFYRNQKQLLGWIDQFLRS